MASPSDKPAQCDKAKVKQALTAGITNAKPNKNGSITCISRKRRPTIMPISSRKKPSKPLKRSPVKGFMVWYPSTPTKNPMNRLPINNTMEPSVNDSCKMPLMEKSEWLLGEAALRPFLFSSTERVMAASNTAMMTAGTSMITRATAMWPPCDTPWLSRNCPTAIKVTALTEP